MCTQIKVEMIGAVKSVSNSSVSGRSIADDQDKMASQTGNLTERAPIRARMSLRHRQTNTSIKMQIKQAKQ
jgi:hypothetical protein